MLQSNSYPTHFLDSLNCNLDDHQQFEDLSNPRASERPFEDIIIDVEFFCRRLKSKYRNHYRSKKILPSERKRRFFLGN